MKKPTLEIQNALDKELSLMKNDFYYQQVEVNKDDKKELVRFDIAFNPIGILGGDTYSLRKTEDGKVIFFILDAMGKGISASITAATSASLLNYIFDQMKRQGDFEFERWLKRYIDFVKNELLDNEMLSIFFACYDKNVGSFNYSSFGMPASLMETFDGEIIKLKSNNAPINRYTDEFTIRKIDVKGIKKALFYTDGLCEAILENGKFYRDKMYQDFVKSKNIIGFNKKVKENITKRDDDILYLYIESLEYGSDFIVRYIKPNMKDINESIYEITRYARENGARPKELSELSLALTELMANALEHGVFGIDKNIKNKLIEDGEFDATLTKYEEEYKDRKIIVKYISKDEEGSKVLLVRIEDGGEGFDTKILRKLVISPQHFNGRGIMITKKLLDRFYYNEKGNVITIRKFLN